MARGQLMPRLTMEATDMEDSDMVMARGLLMPTMVATDMVDTAMARGQLMPRLTMEATDMEDSAMATARGQLMPRPTMVATDMAGKISTTEENHSPKNLLARQKSRTILP